MVLFRHPSRRALQEWLNRDPTDGEEEPSAIDGHLDTCRRCAGILEDLARPADDEAGAVSVGEALARFYSPPSDLADRLERKVVARLDSRVVIEMVSDLFGAGVETSKLLLTEDPTNE